MKRFDLNNLKSDVYAALGVTKSRDVKRRFPELDLRKPCDWRTLYYDITGHLWFPAEVEQPPAVEEVVAKAEETIAKTDEWLEQHKRDMARGQEVLKKARRINHCLQDMEEAITGKPSGDHIAPELMATAVNNIVPYYEAAKYNGSLKGAVNQIMPYRPCDDYWAENDD